MREQEEEVDDDEQWCGCRRRRVGQTCGGSSFATSSAYTTTKAELIVLCTERVQEQMAGSGCREEAVSALMLEKEKDLELAAKIGQNLLAENRELQMRNEFLEQQLSSSDDKVGQLKTALQRKADLLHMVTDDVEAAASPMQSPYSPLSICEDFGPVGGRQSRASFRSLGGRSTRALQSKLSELEEENASLRFEASNLRKVAQELEVKESRIVTDCMKQLTNANEQIELLHGDLTEKVEENDIKQSMVNRLHQEVISRQTSEQSLSIENDELAGQLQAAEEIQGELTQEIMDLQERYAEVVAMLREAQQELKQFRRQLHRSYSPDSAVYESLASELEQSDGSAGHSSVFSPRVPPPPAQQQPPSASEARLLSAIDELSPAAETNLAAETNHQWTAGGCCLPAALEGEGGGGLQMFNPNSRRNVPLPMEETASAMSAADEASRSSNSNSLSKSSSSSLDSLGSDEGKGAGVPGRPGSKDLAWSLKRHNANKQLERCYQKFLQRSRSCRLPAVEPNFAAAKRASLRKRVDPQDSPALKVEGSIGSDSPRLSGALERLKFASYRQGLDFVSAAAAEAAADVRDSSFRSSSAEQSIGSFAMSSTTGAEASPASSHQFSAHSGIVRREVALARCGSATCSPGAWESSAIKPEPQAEQRSRRAVHKSKLVASNSMLEAIRRRLSADLIGLHAVGGLSLEQGCSPTAAAIKSPADVDSLD